MERRRGELHVRSNPVRKKTTTLIYGERSRTMVKRIGCTLVERRRGERYLGCQNPCYPQDLDTEKVFVIVLTDFSQVLELTPLRLNHEKL